MRRYSHILLQISVVMVIITMSCKRSAFYTTEDCANYNYSDCNTTEPLQVSLNIKVTINGENPEVPVSIYEGKVDDNILVLTDTIRTPTYSVLLPPDKYYSVKVRYRKGTSIIYAIGGDKIKKTGTGVCDSTCWTTEQGHVNVELK